MSSWNHPFKTLILVQPTAEDTQALEIPLPSDFYDLGKTWTLKFGGNAKLPRKTQLYRRVYIGDLQVSESCTDAVPGEPLIYHDEVIIPMYQDMLFDVFSFGRSSIQPPSYLGEDDLRHPQSAEASTTASFYDSPYADRTRPLYIKFWLAPIVAPTPVYLSYATLSSIPD